MVCTVCGAIGADVNQIGRNVRQLHYSVGIVPKKTTRALKHSPTSCVSGMLPGLAFLGSQSWPRDFFVDR